MLGDPGNSRKSLCSTLWMHCTRSFHARRFRDNEAQKTKREKLQTIFPHLYHVLRFLCLLLTHVEQLRAARMHSFCTERPSTNEMLQ